MFKSAMGYFGSVAASTMGSTPTDTPTSDPFCDALIGSIVDVGGHKVSVKQRIGEGGFAFVYKVEDLNDSNVKFALKRLLAMDSEKRNMIISEIALMKSLSGHQNIVKFLNAAEAKGVSQSGCGEFLVLMEYCPHNLAGIMSKRNCKPFEPRTVAKIFAQVTSAVGKMHRSQPPIVHRDLKLENLLVDATGKRVKLCDFGSATTEKFQPSEDWSMNQRNMLEEEMAKHTTPMYRAPEMLDTWSNFPVHVAADIWAAGCILYFLCFGRHPFEDSAKLAILNGNFRIPEGSTAHQAFHDLIRQMLAVDPSFRPSIGQVQEHLASICETFGYSLTDDELGLEIGQYENSIPESLSNEGLHSPASAISAAEAAPGGSGLMSSLRGGAGSFMERIRDTSKAVIQTVQQSMAGRGDLDLHLVTERIAVMSFPVDGLESAMKNNIDEIAGILEGRHSNHYSVFNLTERSYTAQKFTTGLVSQPGWSTVRPTAFKVILETINQCLEFLKRDAQNVIVIHCLNGKANSAVLVVGLLLACGFVSSYKDGLKFFALKRCDAVLEPHHRIILRYLETAFSGPQTIIESKVVNVTSVVLEPVPSFSKTSEGCRPFVEVTKSDNHSQSPIKVAPSSEFGSLAFFTAYDEEAVLKVNLKIDGDVIISIYHARQTLSSTLFANKFEKILICRLYFNTGFLGNATSNLRFRLRDLDGVAPNLEKFAKDFKVVVNIRPDKEVKALPLKCKNAGLSLLFETRDEMICNRDMMGNPEFNVAEPPAEEVPKAPPRQKPRQLTPLNDDILISTVMAHVEASAAKNSDNFLLDLGEPSNEPQQAAGLVKETEPASDLLFSDFACPPSTTTATAPVNVDSLLDISGTGKDFGLMAPPPSASMMKTSSSAENFLPTVSKPKDPFDFLGLTPTPTNVQKPQKASSTADDFLSQMLNDLDLKKAPSSSAKPSQQPAAKPNYNVSFNSTNGKASSNGPKVSSNTFEDLLGPNFTPSGSGGGGGLKTIGEMKKVETMKTMTAEEAKVFAWKDGKSRNLRALLCSLHTVIWPNSRWAQCGMHQLVNENDVNKMYKKACLAVHPDKQMGTENEELSKLIFIELNDAWAEFNKD